MNEFMYLFCYLTKNLYGNVFDQDQIFNYLDLNCSDIQLKVSSKYSYISDIRCYNKLVDGRITLMSSFQILFLFLFLLFFWSFKALSHFIKNQRLQAFNKKKKVTSLTLSLLHSTYFYWLLQLPTIIYLRLKTLYKNPFQILHLTPNSNLIFSDPPL
jgi:hypothetical protein